MSDRQPPNGGGSPDPTPRDTAKSDPRHPLTLAVDIGGTGLKASVLDADGAWSPTG